MASIAAAALTLALSSTMQAQTGASRLILATVTDARGRTIVDVGADDFIVQEGRAAREILSVRVADYPIAVLLDTAQPSSADFPLMQSAAAHFIERLGNARPVIVGTFGGTPRLATRLDEERQTVLDRLHAIAADAPGPSEWLRGAALAAEALRASGSLFSAIVVLSAADVAESADASAQTIAPIVDSGAIVHVIANRRPGSPAASPAALRAMVEQTRGEYTPIYAAASYQAALDRLADRLSSEMLIEYLVPPGSKPTEAKVGIRLPGARVRGLGVAPK